MSKLIYIDRIKENAAQFEQKVISIADRLAIDPNWLMVLMNQESGLNHRIQNKTYPVQGGYATGLIQFVPQTARGLGTTTQALMSMSNVEQLDFVYRYFRPYAGRLRSFVDLYLVNFFPIALGKPKNWVFESSKIAASSIAKSNPVFDLNKDGKITIAEFEKAIISKAPEHLRNSLKKKEWEQNNLK